MKDFKALGAKAVELSGKDMTKATTGGGDFTPPAAGFALCRLVGYFEIGKHPSTYQGKTSLKEMVQLVFELSGPRHPPIELEDGTKMPIRIVIEETLSLNEKARFFKLFRTMNYAQTAQHMVQLVGEAFKCQVIHRKYAKRGEAKDDASKWTGLAVELFDKNAGAFTVAPPRVDVVDPNTMMPTGEVKVLEVPAPLTPLKAFMWDHSDLADWNELFIDGEYPERKDKDGKVTALAKSKNVLQNKIKSAANFKSSPIYALIAEAGGNLDIPLPGEDMDDAPDADPTTAVGGATVEQAKVPEGVEADDALSAVV